MKHEVTSYSTKKLLADCLKQEMRKKPFSKISVSEIIRMSGLNRKTFYYHFEDIYALLKWMFDEDAMEVVKSFDLLENYEDAIRFVMRYADENEYLFNCAYDSMGRDEMKRFFCVDFIGLIKNVIEAEAAKVGKTIEADFLDYTAEFYAEALAGMLIKWVKEKDKSDREKTVRYLSDIITLALGSMENYKKTDPV